VAFLPVVLVVVVPVSAPVLAVWLARRQVFPALSGRQP